MESKEVNASWRKSALKISELLTGENLVLCKRRTDQICQVPRESLAASMFAMKLTGIQKLFSTSLTRGTFLSLS